MKNFFNKYSRRIVGTVGATLIVRGLLMFIPSTAWTLVTIGAAICFVCILPED